MDKKLAKLLLGMLKLNEDRFDLLITAGALQGINTRPVRAEHDRIEDELQSIINGGYSNKKETVLLMVEQREFEKRCVGVDLCPQCNGPLGRDNEDQDVKICRACNLDFSHLQ